MYGCESQTIKKAECWRIDAFGLWCWRKLLRVTWTARKSNQSTLKKSVLNIHWKEWCWSWNSNTLATWCKELTHLKKSWCWEKLKVGEEGDNRGWDDWMASSTQWTWVWVGSRSWCWRGKPGMLQSLGSQIVGHNWVIELNRISYFTIHTHTHTHTHMNTISMCGKQWSVKRDPIQLLDKFAKMNRS